MSLNFGILTKEILLHKEDLETTKDSRSPNEEAKTEKTAILPDPVRAFFLELRHQMETHRPRTFFILVLDRFEALLSLEANESLPNQLFSELISEIEGLMEAPGTFLLFVDDLTSSELSLEKFLEVKAGLRSDMSYSVSRLPKGLCEGLVGMVLERFVIEDG